MTWIAVTVHSEARNDLLVCPSAAQARKEVVKVVSHAVSPRGQAKGHVSLGQFNAGAADATAVMGRESHDARS